VVLGAFGAHALAAVLTSDAAATWDMAVQYHLLHALALLCCGILAGQQPSRWIDLAGYGFTAGVLLFSGSLYALSLGAPRWLGPVTPLGGLAFIAGWLALAWSAAARRR
jgi:uncharacterized membrane protein YgdD (TMEM256/DUF423 family)